MTNEEKNGQAIEALREIAALRPEVLGLSRPRRRKAIRDVLRIADEALKRIADGK